MKNFVEDQDILEKFETACLNRSSHPGDTLNNVLVSIIMYVFNSTSSSSKPSVFENKPIVLHSNASNKPDWYPESVAFKPPNHPHRMYFK